MLKTKYDLDEKFAESLKNELGVNKEKDLSFLDEKDI